MALHVPSVRQEIERRFVESLRARYENEGFTFTPHPGGDRLPPFLGSYLPDALAQKPGQNIVIEVKRRSSPTIERSLTSIRRLLEGHSDWQFEVVVMGTDPQRAETIPAAAPDAIRSQADHVRVQASAGHRRSAFVMAWSLLEAVLRFRDDTTRDRIHPPGTIVQTLAMNGYIAPETEHGVRALVALRNRIVHGDLSAEPTMADVEAVLSAIDEALSADMH